MANRDLLKEAIADAKSVKEAAIANAKAALEEAFTPYLKEKFTAKLAEMEKEDMDEAKHEEMDENYGEEKMEEKMSNPVMRHGMKGDDKEEKRTEKMKYGKDLGEAEDMDEEMDLDELLAELDEEMGKDKDMEENLNEDARTDAEEEGYEDGMEDEKEDEEEDEIDLEDMTEDELKDLIEDVIEDMVRAGELEAGESFESDEDEEEEDIDIDMESEEEITERKKEGYDDREDESVSARRGKEADKKQSFKARRDDSYGKFGKRDAEAAGKASGPGKNKINKENLNEEEDMMDEGMLDKLKAVYNDPEVLGKLITVDGKKMSLKDFLAMAASGATGGMKKSGAGKTSSIGEDARTDAEEEGYLDGMKDEKEDMMREIEELASTLAETKLLNAKLLYSNKIFRAKNLNETQKVKVLEAFDKASSVKEAKLIYETLTTVKETKTAVNESVRGMASKAAGMAPEKKPILEVNDQFARWKVLAGIKNN
jgi:hypothetical protein